MPKPKPNSVDKYIAIPRPKPAAKLCYEAEAEPTDFDCLENKAGVEAGNHAINVSSKAEAEAGFQTNLVIHTIHLNNGFADRHLRGRFHGFKVPKFVPPTEHYLICYRRACHENICTILL